MGKSFLDALAAADGHGVILTLNFIRKELEVPHSLTNFIDIEHLDKRILRDSWAPGHRDSIGTATPARRYYPRRVEHLRSRY